jgi:hypothetical protein
MAYDYDIFISYKRDIETLWWIREHFEPLLRHRASLELGRDPSLSICEVTAPVAAGSSWPLDLGANWVVQRC